MVVYALIERFLSPYIPMHLVTNRFGDLYRTYTEEEARRKAEGLSRGEHRKMGILESLRMGKEIKRREERERRKAEGIDLDRRW